MQNLYLFNVIQRSVDATVTRGFESNNGTWYALGSG